MRKENSKYVERDGPIRDGCPEASQTCPEKTYLAFDGQDCECRSVPEVPPNGRLYGPGGPGTQPISVCCKAEPAAKCHADCSTPSGGSGACAKQTPPISYYERSGGPVQTVTCCSSGNENKPCKYTGAQYTANEICNLVGEIHRECEHGPNNYPDEGCTNGKIANRGGNVTIPLSGNFKELVKSGMDEYSCSEKHHGGHRGGKKGKKPNPPSPGPSPNPLGQGNNGGTPGGEIAGIVVGSVAGAIFLLLIVRALVKYFSQKGKKK